MHTRTAFEDTAHGTFVGAGNSGDGEMASGAALARSKDELVREFRNLVSAGEALLRATTNMSGDALAQAREQFREKLAVARQGLSDASRVAMIKGRYAASATDDYVRANPWPAVGVALVTGLLAGVLIARR
jgi:ElaB/YqjD/DUF883 family membrane-anchored ribosome-binding protein